MTNPSPTGMKTAMAKSIAGGAPVSPKEERQDYKTRKDVANSLDPHKRKGGGVVDGNAEAS
jgi:hypothetical protein